MLQGDGGQPWLELGTISELLDLPLRAMPALVRLFAPDGALRRWALVEMDDRANAPGPCRRAKIDRCIAEYLVGVDAFPPGTSLVQPRATLAESLVPPSVGRVAANALGRAIAAREPLLVEISGARGGGRRFLAEALAENLGRPLLVVDLSASRAERPRAGVGGGAAATPSSTERSSASPTGTRTRSSPPRLPRAHRRARSRTAWRAFSVASTASCCSPPKSASRAHRAGFAWGAARRRAVAPYAVGARAAPPWPRWARRGATPAEDCDLEALARRCAIPPACIEAAAHAAPQLLAEDGGPRIVPAALLQQASDRQLRHDLKSVAVRIVDNHRWSDLVVTDEIDQTLREMVAYVRHAGRVYDQWGFGPRHSLSQGISALFSGPPGTGKTMCASVIARELDMELFRVDLATVVSKWVGETEKNLARIFDEAQRSNAIILFDEADSHFAKRTEVSSANDRYANLEVNFLLQRMEKFSGISILTSNHEDAIDPAFKRRLTFRVRFDKPTAEERTLLWARMFPADAELADDVDPTLLGALYEISGGSIRNAAVRAAFLAAAHGRAIDLRTCLDAAERECMEMGQMDRGSADGIGEATRVEDEEPPIQPPNGNGEGRRNGTHAARIVPVTHPRKRSQS